MPRYIVNISQKNEEKLKFCGFDSQEKLDELINDFIDNLNPEEYIVLESDEIYVDKDYDDYTVNESEEVYEDTFEEENPSDTEDNNFSDNDVKEAIQEICAMENINSEVEDELEKLIIKLEKSKTKNE
ncbi:MAG: hypothetical protein E7Z84_07960 [Methanosphaera stadtmanae]|nr:hypothetical protein [Methanosphaera stadtmanae]